MTQQQMGLLGMAVAIAMFGLFVWVDRKIAAWATRRRIDRQIEQAIAMVAQEHLSLTWDDMDWLEHVGVAPESLTEEP